MIEEKGQSHYVLIKNLNTFIYTIKHYIVIGNTFVVIVSNFLLLHKYYKEILMIDWKIVANKWLKWLKKLKLLNSKTIQEK